jgi:glycosyltransferase involved in cell wall biosynthesis
MAQVRFSIIITCYNQHDFIRNAVDSALSQHCESKEVIVIDDGSSDDSSRMLQQYGDSIQLIQFSNNRGTPEARNQGAAVARGEYLVFLDGDDLLAPWALDVYERVIDARNPIIIEAERLWFKGNIPLLRSEGASSTIKFAEYPNLLAKDRPQSLSASAFVVDRSAFADVGGWSPGIFHMDLLDLTTKLGCSGRLILIFSPFTVLYRVHDANVIHTVPPFLQMSHYLLAKERGGQYPGGRELQFQRRARLGAGIFWLTTRGLKSGLYKDSLRLAIAGWSMIVAAIVHRSEALIRGRHPINTLETPSAAEETNQIINQENYSMLSWLWDKEGSVYVKIAYGLRCFVRTLVEPLRACLSSKLVRVVVLVAFGAGMMWMLLHARHNWHLMHNSQYIRNH